MEEKKKKRGRPQIEIDKLEFEKLCEFQATKKDIANTFNVGEATIDRWCQRTYGMNFEDTFDRKRVKGLNSLRAKQYETAMKGNVSMMIWLGRNWLGQKDDPGKLAVNLEIEDLTPLAEMLRK